MNLSALPVMRYLSFFRSRWGIWASYMFNSMERLNIYMRIQNVRYIIYKTLPWKCESVQFLNQLTTEPIEFLIYTKKKIKINFYERVFVVHECRRWGVGILHFLGNFYNLASFLCLCSQESSPASPNRWRSVDRINCFYYSVPLVRIPRRFQMIR